MNKHDKEVALRTLINVTLRDIGLRHRDVTYTFNTMLDRVTAFSGNKQVCIQYGDNLDTIDEITVTSFNKEIYKKENIQMRDMFNGDIVNALMEYDFGDHDE